MTKADKLSQLYTVDADVARAHIDGDNSGSVRENVTTSERKHIGGSFL